MRIVLVNWARIWDGAASGGGVNQYCQALALELVRRGHEVVSLCSGTAFVNDPVTGRACVLRRHPDWLGVRVFEIVNSPVIAPSLVQFADPLGEVSAPELEARVAELFDQLRPDAVHWNNIEGFSIGCVAAARAVGARVIFSLHNYHTICPQVYLLRHHRIACTNADNGHACSNCVTPLSAAKARADAEEQAMLAIHAQARLRRQELADSLRLLTRPVTAGVRYLRAALAARRDARLAMPGRAANFPASITEPWPPSADDARGKTPYLLAELNPPAPEDRSLPQYRPIDNTVEPEPPSDKPVNNYGRRRSAMIAMLNSCDRVLAVSDFVRRKFESLGVEPRVICTQAIGSRINRVIALKPDLVFDPPEFARPPLEPRPVRLHFMGYNNYYKGLTLLALALEELEPEHLRRFHISIFAQEGHTIEWMFRRLEPRLAGLTFGYEYNYHDIPWMLGGKDLTVVPSVWWDNAPQTVFESMACGVPVLGAALGGIPDFVHHGVNGLLFRGNDREDLKRRLREVAANPWQLIELRRNVRPPKSIETHAVEIERIYAGDEPPPCPPADGAAAPFHAEIAPPTGLADRSLAR